MSKISLYVSGLGFGFKVWGLGFGSLGQPVIIENQPIGAVFISFNKLHCYHILAVAQWLRRPPVNPDTAGSKPTHGTFLYGIFLASTHVLSGCWTLAQVRQNANQLCQAYSSLRSPGE